MAPFILGTWLLLSFFNLYGIEYVSDGLTVEKTFSQELVQKAENGDPEAQYHLGACYDGGSGVERNPAKAVEWYKKAAGQNSLKAQFRLGHIYECNAHACANPDCRKCPVKIDIQESLKWRRQAAEGGMTEAQIILGKKLSEYGSLRNDEEARMWLKKAALNGSEEAKEILKKVPSYGRKRYSNAILAEAEKGSCDDQLSLGRCYLYGEGVSKDLTLAEKWLKKAAENTTIIGNSKVEAQLLLAEINSNNPPEAQRWYRAAAESGDIGSKIKIANIILSNHPESTETRNEAEQWLYDANSQGDPVAALTLAKFYLTKEVNKKENVLPLLYDAAGKGSGEAASMIGSIFYEGNIADKDIKKSLEWFKRAKNLGYTAAQTEIDQIANEKDQKNIPKELIEKAEKGDSEAELRLGLKYYQEGKPENQPDEAKKWFERSAQKDNPVACRLLGELFSKNFLPLDNNYGLNNARPWLEQAVAGGDKNAAKILGILLIQESVGDEMFEKVVIPKGLLEPLAQNGDLEAKEALIILRSRWPFPVSKQIEDEALNGNPDALYDLGYAYTHGEGVPKDPEKALGYFKMAYEKGHQGCWWIYAIYKNMLKNETEANKWYKLFEKETKNNYAKEMEEKQKRLLKIRDKNINEIAANIPLKTFKLLEDAALGNAYAQLVMGVYCFQGYDIKNKKALEWYEKAVLNGDAESAYRIGEAYTYGGLGLKKDFVKAEEYLSKAAKKEYGDAQAKLGILYYEGKDLPKDTKEGMRLILKGKENGSNVASSYLEALNRK